LDARSAEPWEINGKPVFLYHVWAGQELRKTNEKAWDCHDFFGGLGDSRGPEPWKINGEPLNYYYSKLAQ